MGLQTTTVTVDGARAPLLGLTQYDDIPVASFAPLTVINGVYPDNVIAAPQPGFWPIASNPVTERDSVANVARNWTAHASGTVTLEASGAVLGGLPRFKATGGGTDGLRATLSANLDSYTIAALVRPNTLTTAAVFGAGTDGASRLVVYYVNTGNMALQHGSGDSLAATGSITEGQWHALIWTFDNATNAVSMYQDSATALGSGTLSNNPPTTGGTSAALMSTADNALEMTGEIAFFRIWDRAITDADSLETLIAGMTSLAAL
jgi:hypothetical protein